MKLKTILIVAGGIGAYLYFTRKKAPGVLGDSTATPSQQARQQKTRPNPQPQTQSIANLLRLIF